MGGRSGRLLQTARVSKDPPARRELGAPRPATLTVKQAARALGVDPQTVYRLVHSDPPGIDAVWVRSRIKIPLLEFCDRFKIPLDYDFGPP